MKFFFVYFNDYENENVSNVQLAGEYTERDIAEKKMLEIALECITDDLGEGRRHAKVANENKERDIEEIRNDKKLSPNHYLFKNGDQLDLYKKEMINKKVEEKISGWLGEYKEEREITDYIMLKIGSFAIANMNIDIDLYSSSYDRVESKNQTKKAISDCQDKFAFLDEIKEIFSKMEKSENDTVKIGDLDYQKSKYKKVKKL